MKKVEQYKGPMRFAHRGMVQDAPENTIGAFEAAINAGCEGIEIDVVASKDGQVIVAHDGNFTRMTCGHPNGGSNKFLKDMTAEEICAVELPFANHLLDPELPKWSQHEGLAILPFRVLGQETPYEIALQQDPRMTHLMTFAEFDAWFATRPENVTIEIEVKAPGIAKTLFDIIRAGKNADRYIVFSGVPAYNEELQGLIRTEGKPEGLRMGANLRYMNDETRKAVEEWDLFEIGLNAEHFTQEDVLWLKERGISVLSNLGDYPAWWEKLCSMDVLGFKTNYAEAFTKWWMENHQ
ncbi:MAG: hypothetical protein IJ042_08990 [Butyricicoccus sp.]|nr:hypothetical protein [Butyricicoccus sp.]